MTHFTHMDLAQGTHNGQAHTATHTATHVAAHTTAHTAARDTHAGQASDLI